MEADIPFALPFMGPEEEEAVIRVLRSGWLTTGREALALEEAFAAEAAGEAPAAALAVNSATSGLHLALEACGLGPGDLALVPSYTFTSTAEVVRYLGADPVFVDLAPGSFLMDPAALETTLERLNQGLPAYPPRPGERGQGFGPRGRPRAALPVHLGGLVCDMGALGEIARRYGLKLIEDAAHAFPLAGGLSGDAAVFSFYATKTLCTGEGGMVLCRDPELAARIRVMRSHGIDRSIWNRYTDKSASWYYEVVEPGFKYNLPDILAAIGRVQLGRAASLLRMREDIAERYNGAFRGNRHLELPPTAPGNAWHLYPLRLRLETLKIDRNGFIEALKARGIGVSVHFIPLHTMPYYKQRYGLEAGDFPETLGSYRREVSLPIWPGMSGAQLDRVIDAVLATVRESRK
ncbi:MAG: DegT/DnrJ/EryC1/StrS aminotransferase family protein [Treponema sp.]|jgi:dTDP-4-amino-4,6-dideoxygalactose transaminase|nr:DegT/DnrJ/EryC1/StrS aminotransferase family protein [Treponema sp.]